LLIRSQAIERQLFCHFTGFWVTHDFICRFSLELVSTYDNMSIAFFYEFEENGGGLWTAYKGSPETFLPNRALDPW
jgi:hypothetical protein